MIGMRVGGMAIACPICGYTGSFSASKMTVSAGEMKAAGRIAFGCGADIEIDDDGRQTTHKACSATHEKRVP